MSSTLCNIPNIGIRNQPIDNGNYLFTEEEKNIFIEKEPQSKKYFHQWIGSKELINGYKKYCLWLGNCSENEISSMPESKKRVESVRTFRLNSNRVSTKRLSEKPTRFQVENIPTSNYIIIPRHSSENRAYIPIVFSDKSTLVGDSCLIVIDSSLYELGILSSSMHMAWVRTVCGRIKSDYRYSASIVYNTFPWPDASEEQKKAVSELADMVLNIRNMYPDKTLAEMYDPDKMPEPLAEAHHNLDMAVDSLYRNTPFESDEERLQLLFKLYEKLVAAKNAKEKPHA